MVGVIALKEPDPRSETGIVPAVEAVEADSRPRPGLLPLTLVAAVDLVGSVGPVLRETLKGYQHKLQASHYFKA